MPDLITAGQALALLPGLAPAEAQAVPALAPAASRAVEAWCRRKLAFGPHVEFHRPGRSRKIRLDHPPVVPGSVGLRTDLVAVAEVACTDPAARRATASLTATALTLSRFASGGPTTATLTLASYPTVGGLAAAIAATGAWSCSVAPGYSGWLTADLEPSPGAMGALGRPARLAAFVRDLSDWAMPDPDLGIVELAESRPEGFRYPDRAWGSGARGDADPRHADVRCSYQAGYDPLGVSAPAVPADLMQAVALTIRALLDSGQFSGAITSATLGNTSFDVGDRVAAIPPAALTLLSPYRLRRF